MSRFSSLRNHLSFGEALRIYLRLKSGNRKHMKISRLRHPFSMRRNPHDYGTFEEVIVKQGYDLPLGFRPGRIIDGGGNIGLTAAYFATKFPDAEIVTIEPDTENFELLSENTRAYGNIKPLQGGIWSRSAYLVVKDMGLGNNGFMVEEAEPGVPGAIRAWSIPEIMKNMNWNSCDVVKLDVEGSEKEIFSENFEGWLPRTKVLVIELHDRMKKGCSRAVFSALSRYRFSLHVAGENLVFTNEDPL